MPERSRAEQLLGLAAGKLAALKAGDDVWYTPGEIGRDWKQFDEVKAFPFYGVIEGGTAPVGDDTQDGGGVLEQTVIVVIWVHEDKIAWIQEEKNRRVALLRSCQDVVRAITQHWHNGPDWLMDVSRPSVITDEATLLAKPFAYGEVTVRFRYWADVGTI